VLRYFLRTRRISEFGYDSNHEAAAPMTYDAAGNRTTMAATLTSSAAYSGSTTYQFDVRDELTSEASTRIGGYANSFAYDGSENATTMRSVSGVTYSSDNQLTRAIRKLNRWCTIHLDPFPRKHEPKPNPPTDPDPPTHGTPNPGPVAPPNGPTQPPNGPPPPALAPPVPTNPMPPSKGPILN
jgi:hypothetical protein